MNQFYMGVVESREDPLKLNRVQVRVFGVHTESLEDIPTDKLPWAVCLSVGAAISGIGHSGAQYLEGTVVFLFFQDGESKQVPIIIGGMHGVPIGISPFPDVGEIVVDSELVVNKVESKIDYVPAVINDQIGVPVDSSATTGKPVVKEPEKKPTTETPSTKTSAEAREALKKMLGERESSNNYNAFNEYGYVGKYQMGSAYLADRGYMKKGVTQSQANMNNPANWTGKDGINNIEDFKKNKAVQEKAIDAGLDANERQLKKMGIITDATTEQEKGGWLATAHLVGAGGARDLKNGVIRKDGNKVPSSKYYDLGYAAVAGKPPAVSPSKTTPDNPSREPSVNPAVGKTIAKEPVAREDEVGLVKTDVTAGGVASVATAELGFQDPNEVYPTYLDEQDTNRLARNQNIGETNVPIKEELEHKNVPKANGVGIWSQSRTPYNAKYPFNLVYETESGHVLELDDTPNNERVHIYHRMGTFIEIDANGTMVRRIVGDNYEVCDRDGYIHIKGDCSITVDGNANILVGNDCELEVDGKLRANVGKDMDLSIGGDAKFRVGGDVHWVIKGDELKTIHGDKDTEIKKSENFIVGGDSKTAVDGSRSITVDGDNKHEVGGSDSYTTIGNEIHDIGGKFSSVVGTAWSTVVGTLMATTVGGSYTIVTGGTEEHTNGGAHSTTSAGFFTSVDPAIGNSSAVPAVILLPSETDSPDLPGTKELKPPPNVSDGRTPMGPLDLEPRAFEELSAFEDDDLTVEEAADREAELRDAGLVDPEPEPVDISKEPTVTVPTEAKEKNEKPVTCGAFVSGKINTSEYISTNYRLAHLSGKTIPRKQAGLDDVEIACNLKKLAENVLEPILKKYPTMYVVSALRPPGSNPNSNHPKGLCADIQFGGIPSSEYAAIAKDISGMVPFDQLIMEYRTGANSPTVPWIHVGLGGAGGNRGMVFTMNNHKRCSEMGQIKVIK